MDSSRSGLLSTLLMTLPLIIVPAIALLRPAGGPAGVAQTTAQGAESSEDLLGFEQLDTSEIPPTDAPEFPVEPTRGSPETATENSIDDLLPNQTRPKPVEPKEPQSSDPFQQAVDAPATESPDGQPENFHEDAATEAALRQLNAMGAIRVLWFVPGTTENHGFAAFFRGETELVRYRFEAIGPTRSACAEDVVQQVKHWRQQSARRANRLN
ncbi:MAG: hypothetical protein ACKPJJ_30200 [Planctomycetaceae bacterium]